jgi:hypothetical protein
MLSASAHTNHSALALDVRFQHFLHLLASFRVANAAQDMICNVESLQLSARCRTKNNRHGHGNHLSWNSVNLPPVQLQLPQGCCAQQEVSDGSTKALRCRPRGETERRIQGEMAEFARNRNELLDQVTPFQIDCEIDHLKVAACKCGELLSHILAILARARIGKDMRGGHHHQLEGSSRPFDFIHVLRLTPVLDLFANADGQKTRISWFLFSTLQVAQVKHLDTRSTRKQTSATFTRRFFRCW